MSIVIMAFVDLILYFSGIFIIDKLEKNKFTKNKDKVIEILPNKIEKCTNKNISENISNEYKKRFINIEKKL